MSSERSKGNSYIGLSTGITEIMLVDKQQPTEERIEKEALI